MCCVLIIPIFNRIDKIKKLLESDFLTNNFSFLFVDDHSTDGSYELLQSLSCHNVSVIKSSRKDSFWYGAIYDGVSYVFQNDNFKNYHFFGFMNDDVEIESKSSHFDFNSLDCNGIYFAPAYWSRKKIYTGGHCENGFISSTNKSDIIKNDYNSVGGFFTIFGRSSLEVICKNKLPEIIVHYHADTLITLNLSRLGHTINVLDSVTVIVDDSDKTRLANMTVVQRLTNVRSPYEWKSSIYWYLLSKLTFGSFIKSLFLHFSKSVFFGLYFKFGEKK